MAERYGLVASFKEIFILNFKDCSLDGTGS